PRSRSAARSRISRRRRALPESARGATATPPPRRARSSRTSLAALARRPRGARAGTLRRRAPALAGSLRIPPARTGPAFPSLAGLLGDQDGGTGGLGDGVKARSTIPPSPLPPVSPSAPHRHPRHHSAPQRFDRRVDSRQDVVGSHADPDHQE